MNAPPAMPAAAVAAATAPLPAHIAAGAPGIGGLTTYNVVAPIYFPDRWPVYNGVPTLWHRHPTTLNVLRMTAPSVGPWKWLAAGAVIVPNPFTPAHGTFSVGPPGSGAHLHGINALASTLAATVAYSVNREFLTRAGRPCRGVGIGGAINLPQIPFNAIRYRLYINVTYDFNDGVDRFVTMDLFNLPTDRVPFPHHGGLYVTHRRIVDNVALYQAFVYRLWIHQHQGSDPAHWRVKNYRAWVYNFVVDNELGGCTSRKKSDTTIIINNIKYFSPKQGRTTKNDCFYRCILTAIKNDQMKWNGSRNINRFIKEVNERLHWTSGALVSVEQIMEFAHMYEQSIIVRRADDLSYEDNYLPFNDDSKIRDHLVPGVPPITLYLFQKHWLLRENEVFVQQHKCEHCGKGRRKGVLHRCQPVTVTHCQRPKMDDDKMMNSTQLPDLDAEGRRKRIHRMIYGNWAEQLRAEEVLVQETMKQVEAHGRSVLIVGSAGTGKTYTVRKMIQLGAIESSKKCMIVAHDGIAVSNYLDLQNGNVKVGTIHSTFHIPIHKDIEQWFQKIQDQCVSRDLYHQHKRAKVPSIERNLTIRDLTISIEGLHLLVIDEVNTLSPYLFEIIDRLFRLIRGSNNPFGGIQLVLTGDFTQREPISHDNIAMGVYMSPIFQRLNLHVCYLSLVKRVQNLTNDDEKRFLEVQLRIGEGVVTEDDLTWLNEKQQCPRALRYNRATTVLCSTNKLAVRHNNNMKELFYRHQPGVERFEVVAKNWPLNDEKAEKSLRRKCQLRFEFYIGMKVLLTSNYWLQSDGVCNGSFGTVVAPGPDFVLVRFDKEKEVNITQLACGHAVIQLPLLPGYAVTICKSEGLSLHQTVLMIDYDKDSKEPSERSFGNGEIYVGISRATSVNRFGVIGTLRSSHITYSINNRRFTDYCRKQRLPNEEEYTKQFIRNIGHTAKTGDSRSPVMVLTDKTKGRHRIFNPVFTYEDNSVKIFTPDGQEIQERHLIVKALTEYEDKKKRQEKNNEALPHNTFEHAIVYDFETWNNKSTNYIHSIYFVHANYWRSNRIIASTTICKESDDENVDEVFNKFTHWVFDIIRKTNEEFEHTQSRRMLKKHIPTITMIAFNGSRYDTHFISHKLWNSREFNELFIHSYTVRSKAIITLELRSRKYPWKSILRMWDPCLIVMSSLHKAVSSYCPDLKQNKDVFPHNYINTHGPLKSIGEDREVEVDIHTDFYSDKDRGTIRERIEKGELKSGSKENTVLMNLRRQLYFYGKLDVYVLERLVIAMDCLSFNDILPGVSVFSFATAAQMTTYGWLSNMGQSLTYKPQQKKKEEEKDKNSPCRHRKYTQIHLLSQRLDKEVRKSVYGGRCYPRISQFVHPELEDIEKKTGKYKDKTPEEVYNMIQEAYVYMDVHGMYVSIMHNREFPYGPHTELINQEANDEFTKWLKLLRKMNKRGQDLRENKLPMFVCRVDVVTNKKEVEAPLPQRGYYSLSENKVLDKGGLFWTNQDKVQEYYNSVDLILALRNGCVLKNCTWMLKWEKKGPILRTWMEKTLAIRARGGAFKSQGKLLGNSTYGVTLKGNYNTEWRTITNAKELDDVVRDPDVNIEKCVEQGATNFIHMMLKREVDADDAYSRSCPGIGTFVLGYAHEMLDKYYEAVNPHRRHPSLTLSLVNQVAYTDTDSIIFKYRRLQSPEVMRHVGDKNGLLGDDLADKWGAKTIANGKTCTKCIKYNNKYCIHEIHPCKIIEGYWVSPKVYAMKYIDPKGVIHDDTLKFKGIPKDNIKVQEGAAERDDLFIDSLTFDHFKEQKPLTVSKVQFGKTLFHPSRKEMVEGVAPLQVRRDILSRRIFANPWEKRQSIVAACPKLKGDFFEQRSVPIGYEFSRD